MRSEGDFYPIKPDVMAELYDEVPAGVGYQDRVRIEKSDLDEKISKLRSFIKSEKFGSVDGSEASRLTCQLEVMGRYSDILSERIQNFS